MTWSLRAFVGALLTVLAIVPATLHADNVQLTVRDGRISLVANNATPAQIFDAWSRAGGILVVNADRIPSAPITITLENVPEEQALDTLLRPVTGYLARRRVEPSSPGRSMFDRIVIVPTPAAARPATVPAAATPTPGRSAGGASPVFPQAPPPTAMPQPMPRPQPAAQNPGQPPNAIPQGPGVMRLLGPDGQPVEDDQGGAPPAPYNGGDAPDNRPPVAPPRSFAPPPQQPQPPQQQPAPPSTSAPAGVPRPGMVVPAPNQPGQPTQQPQQR